MKLALLTGLAAVLAGVTGAQAADFYAAAPGYVYSQPGYAAAPAYAAPAPAYTYRPVGPAPFMPPGYVIAEPVPSYVVTEPQTVVVERPAAPMVIAPPRRNYVVRTAPAVRTIETTGYATERSCFIDLAGFERCY